MKEGGEVDVWLSCGYIWIPRRFRIHHVPPLQLHLENSNSLVEDDDGDVDDDDDDDDNEHND